MYRPSATYFPVRPDLNSVNKHFIIWALYTIHEHSEYEVWTKQVTKICTENLSNMLFAFTFLAVNNLGVKKRRNPLKLHHAEQYVFLAGAVRLFPALLALLRPALIRAFSQ